MKAVASPSRFPRSLSTSVPWLILSALAGGGDGELGAVLGDSAAFDLDAGLLELRDDLVVAEGLALILGIDDLLDLGLDAVPAEGLSVGELCAAGEEPAQREDPARGLNPLFIDGAADGGGVAAEAGGQIAHAQDLEMLLALVKEVALRLDDGLGDLE